MTCDQNQWSENQSQFIVTSIQEIVIIASDDTLLRKCQKARKIQIGLAYSRNLEWTNCYIKWIPYWYIR